jgi:hypothetical protein
MLNCLPFLPKKIGHSEKSWCLKFLGILGILTLLNNCKHLINVEDGFHLCPKTLGNLRFFWSNNFGEITKTMFFGHCPPFRVLSHMKVIMLGRTTLGQMSCTFWDKFLTPLGQMCCTSKTNVNSPKPLNQEFLYIWCKYTFKPICVY